MQGIHMVEAMPKLHVCCLKYCLLVHYFQNIHNNVMFEVKGLIINEAENDILVHTIVCETMKFKLSTTVAIYSLCYSIMKSCA